MNQNNSSYCVGCHRALDVPGNLLSESRGNVLCLECKVGEQDTEAMAYLIKRLTVQVMHAHNEIVTLRYQLQPWYKERFL